MCNPGSSCLLRCFTGLALSRSVGSQNKWSVTKASGGVLFLPVINQFLHVADLCQSQLNESVLLWCLFFFCCCIKKYTVSQWFFSRLPRIPSNGWAFRVRMTQRSGVSAWNRLGTDLGGTWVVGFTLTHSHSHSAQLKTWFIVVIALNLSSFYDGRSCCWRQHGHFDAWFVAVRISQNHF